MAAALRTPQDVMHCVGVVSLPEYFAPEPMIDCVGFAVTRAYPPNTLLGSVVTKSGTPSIVCWIQFVVDPPPTPSGVSRVHLNVFLHDRWKAKHWEPPSSPVYDFDDPDCPTPEAVCTLRKAPKPLSLNFIDNFVYDTMEEKFYDERGQQWTGKAMLDWVYDYHCRTLRWRFRIKRWVGNIARGGIRGLVWHGQKVCMWLLHHGYDITPTPEALRNPFHEFEFSDFKRTTDREGSTFFGFQSSKRSLFANLVALAFACLMIYCLVPRFGLLRAIYSNTALTTAALVFGFLIADQLVPLVLQGAVCRLSRLRPGLMFLGAKVRA